MTSQNAYRPEDIKPILRYLKKHVHRTRLKHILGTWRTAERLADRHGVPRLEAAQAALLHDIGRTLSDRALVDYTRRHRLRVPLREEIITHCPSLLHGFVSAHMARGLFRITCKRVLGAIAFHTIAHRKMDKLAKIIYIADSISPERRYHLVHQLRRESMRDLDAAFLMTLTNKLHHVIFGGAWLHPHSVAAWNALIKTHRNLYE